jgi:ribonuclease E
MSKTISKKMLINVMHPEEARVAIVHDGRLMELNIEITGKEQTKGNIYKGVVLRVEPGLQAAFIDIGRAKPGFLQMGELHPDFWQWRDDVPEDQRKRRPRIQEVLRRGQELIVQVEKDERDHKGSALTSYISLPGRYMVIMPGSDSSGISRKVEQEGERKKLKEIVAGMNVPEGIGYIIRTEAVGRSPEELRKDFDSLLEMYAGIKQHAAEIKGAGEIYQDRGLIIRTIRDYFSDDIDEVLVDSKEAYKEAKDFFRETMPACEKLVKLHKEKRPIFSRFQLEEQIDQIYEKRVSLPSGGSLIIEPTEALVSIDVNSGKSSGERGIEDTAFKTNMEAVEEVARQLRLRDLGGLIVIDLIDMRENKHNHEVEKALKQALKMDKARVNVGRISEFGMLEMSRQRIAKTLNDAIHLECPHCEGRGKVKSVEAMALSFLRKVHGAAAKGTVSEVHGGLPLEVAYYLLNRKKRELVQIENDYEIEVTVKGKTSYLLNQVELETVKRDKPRSEDLAKSEAEAEEAHKPVVRVEAVAVVAEKTVVADQVLEGGALAETSKKRKRRRKKKKTGVDGAPATELAEGGLSEIEQTVPDEEVEATEGDDGAGAVSSDESGAKPKKRKRRRGKKKPFEDAAPESGLAETTAEVVDPAVPEAEVTPVAETAADTEESLPDAEAAPNKRKRRRGKKGTKIEGEAEQESETAVAAVESLPEMVPSPEPEIAQTVKSAPPAEKTKHSRATRTRKKTSVEVVPELPPVPASEPAVSDVQVIAEETVSSPKPRRRVAAKKTREEAVPEPEAAKEKVKPAPRTRKKKVEEIQ